MIKYATRQECMDSPEGRALYARLKDIIEEAPISNDGSKPQFYGSQAYLEHKVWLILNNSTQKG